MTLSTHKQLMLSEISASTALQPELIIKARAEAEKLRSAGFSTQAFLHLWIVTEVAAKELMCIYKYTKDTHDALKKIQPELKRALQPHLNAPTKVEANEQALILTAKALPSFISPFYSLFKVAAQISCRQLNVAVIKSAFAVLELMTDEQTINYLLTTKIKQLPMKIEFTDKITIRERRNRLVHTNRQVDDATLAQLLPVFDYFFSLLQQLTTQFAVSQQLNLDNEVAE